MRLREWQQVIKEKFSIGYSVSKELVTVLC